MPEPAAARRIGAFHHLADLTEARIAAAADASPPSPAEQPPPPAVDVPLPDVPDADDASVTLVDALARRRTSREPAEAPLELDRLGRLLAHAARTHADARRPQPSAGAGYPLRIDVVALRCTGLDAGVHRYEPDAHGLRTTSVGDPTDDLEVVFGRTWVRRARVAVVLGVDLPAATAHHDDRGYRYALLEAGHLAQNLLLLAAAADLPACPLGGFADRALATLVGGSPDEVPLYAVVL
ncbi:SagB/ThcOx family dehydrogenase [Nitriliruptor alkaliphilus]|uniref:SagB/ThcOx family dehydrogenase n=1 Tax=Nitriliruptor alkaliphilus TaxID=427918 RepID=UPI0006990778|nr:SagB/ThcOx family dehydrogenase [Nitriliruptor alkaliphilus]